MLYKFLPLVSEMLWSISQHTVWKFEITVTKLFEKLLNMCSTNISLSNIPSLVFLHFYIKYNLLVHICCVYIQCRFQSNITA